MLRRRFVKCLVSASNALNAAPPRRKVFNLGQQYSECCAATSILASNTLNAAPPLRKAIPSLGDRSVSSPYLKVIQFLLELPFGNSRSV
jgi:hypothetical protein